MNIDLEIALGFAWILLAVVTAVWGLHKSRKAPTVWYTDCAICGWHTQGENEYRVGWEFARHYYANHDHERGLA